MEMSPLIRANATGVLISTNIKNKREISSLTDEYGDAVGGVGNFMKMFNYCAQEEYAWLYLQLDTGRAYKNFTEQIYPTVSKDLEQENSDLEEDDVNEDEEK